jgi:hypothetical protein
MGGHVGCLFWYYLCPLLSVVVAKAEVFRKNVIIVGKRFAKILKIFDNIDHIKNHGVI